MDRDLAEWARVFAWDARWTITQTYKERISQSMGFADQFREGFTWEQFTNYLNTIEAQASFMSFLDPITAYITPKLNFFGSLCSVTICCFTGVMSLHRAYRYIQQSRLARVTVSVVTLLKLLCCAPATILADEMYRHSLVASLDQEYGYIPEQRRADKRRAKRPLPKTQLEDIEEEQVHTEGIYMQATPGLTIEKLPMQTNPSAPTYDFKAQISNSLSKVVPFVYPALQQPTLQPSFQDNFPKCL